MKKFLVHPATFKLDGGAMFGIIPMPLWQKKIMPDELNRILMSLRVMYIEMGEKKILIDTGIGDYHSDKFQAQFDIKSISSPLTTILKKSFDIDPSDITDIIITHMHFDHIGGLTEGESEKLTFPNATVHLHEKHYEYSKKPTLRDAGSFQSHFFKPVLAKYLDLGRINFLTGEEGVIITSGKDKIEFKTSFGHTPYMIHPIFDNYIYMADLVPMSHHLNIPWVMGYDIEPGTTTIYKEKFYKYILENDLTMLFEHDNEFWGATIEFKDNKYKFKELFESDKKHIQSLD